MAKQLNHPQNPSTTTTNKTGGFSENLKFLLSVSIPAVIAISGWLTANYFQANRDRDNKLRDVKMQYLIDSYRDLLTSLSKDSLITKKNFSLVEDAFNKIQLFGSDDQIELAHQIMQQINIPKTPINLNPLVNSLRNDLRKQLMLPEENTAVYHLVMVDSTY